MKISITIIGIMFSVAVLAQGITRNNIFIQAGGPLGLYSVNYDRFLMEDKKINLAVRIGLAYDINNPNTSIIAPISLSLLKNLQNSHYLELRLALRNEYSRIVHTYSQRSGMGDPNPTYDSYEEVEYEFTIYPSIDIGYRYQPQSTGLFLNCLVQFIGTQAYYTEDIWYNKLTVGAGCAF